ncbi:hypothetical protein Q4Q34_12810 [Flavivirga abyssicola]|uniref:hypothetical protein n=1 Tax=Flavivirga abyssicola TaxID=3063533 RepID=UPI0026DF732D|nr:hypothetical protein [Flavivirga sp. MEBiC07777]WVK12099.1 hypothetical protein Q4Q34_12810 [Flavivirga sp. MEBiC07777]
MKKNADRYLDSLAKKVIKEAPLERPSFNFTVSVMSQVTELSNNSITVYKPLISKKGWIVISIVFFTLIIYMLLGIQEEPTSWFDSLDLSVLSNNKLTSLFSGFSMPKSLTYAVMLFGLMFCIQIPLLKNHFNQKFQN